ncbi:MAG: hypothetical protein BMS9Abin23_0327 [Thermodesulfobacteriota bacterium]|nr:MAG: hypothetical protein BMS9Abin23_0327 [Thermodesulfobacteriota bacterium]
MLFMTGLLRNVEMLKELYGPVLSNFPGGHFYGSYGGRGAAILGILLFLILFFAAVVLALWIVMPFYVFSLRGLVKKCVREQEKTNALLERLIDKEEGRKSGDDDIRPRF